MPPPPRHRTDTKKSEANQAEGGGFGNCGCIREREYLRAVGVMPDAILYESGEDIWIMRGIEVATITSNSVAAHGVRPLIAEAKSAIYVDAPVNGRKRRASGVKVREQRQV